MLLARVKIYRSTQLDFVAAVWRTVQYAGRYAYVCAPYLAFLFDIPPDCETAWLALYDSTATQRYEIKLAEGSTPFGGSYIRICLAGEWRPLTVCSSLIAMIAIAASKKPRRRKKLFVQLEYMGGK